MVGISNKLVKFKTVYRDYSQVQGLSLPDFIIVNSEREAELFRQDVHKKHNTDIIVVHDFKDGGKGIYISLYAFEV